MQSTGCSTICTASWSSELSESLRLSVALSAAEAFTAFMAFTRAVSCSYFLGTVASRLLAFHK